MKKVIVAGNIEDCIVHKISANDSNKFVLLCDGTQAPFVSVIEIFDAMGKTPPNFHSEAVEYFYILSGEGIAVVDGNNIELKPGSFLIVPPGQYHEVHNISKVDRLYALTTMVPDENFSKLIKSGPKDYLDDQDLKKLKEWGI